MEIMQRRSFLVPAVAALPLVLAADAGSQSMYAKAIASPHPTTGPQPASSEADPHLVRNGEARLSERHNIGVSSTNYKVLTADTGDADRRAIFTTTKMSTSTCSMASTSWNSIPSASFSSRAIRFWVPRACRTPGHLG
jgi:hypothetical protein